ncbi:MAG: ribonuclease P [Methanoregula sp.]|nr:MAG: ribonuclease P [Methanoregula sp.]
MMITDSCVYPRPLGDSSVRRMALVAHEFGFDSLVAVNTPPCKHFGVTVETGIVIGEMPAPEVTREVKRSRETGAIVSVMAGDNGRNRMVLGIRGVDILCGIHKTDRHAFDHVTARMAADNGVAVDISLEPVIHGRGMSRQKALDRYHDILLLHRRFEFPLVLSTHARSVLDMHPVREFSGLASVIGLDLSDVEQALSHTGQMRSLHSAVRVVT